MDLFIWDNYIISFNWMNLNFLNYSLGSVSKASSPKSPPDPRRRSESPVMLEATSPTPGPDEDEVASVQEDSRVTADIVDCEEEHFVAIEPKLEDEEAGLTVEHLEAGDDWSARVSWFSFNLIYFFITSPYYNTSKWGITWRIPFFILHRLAQLGYHCKVLKSRRNFGTCFIFANTFGNWKRENIIQDWA